MNSQIDYEDIIKLYKEFPDKSGFAVAVEDDRLVFYYSNSEGLKKARFLALSVGVDADFIKTTEDVVLSKIEEVVSFDGEGSLLESISEDSEFSYEDDILVRSHEDAPVIKLVNQIVIDAVKLGASDIHFENDEDLFRVRIRLDGKLHEYRSFPKGLHDPVIARIKVMAMLDVAERRKPQDGRINVRIGNRNVDIRVSVIPSIKGEKAVLRLLEKSRNLMTLDRIGMPDHMLKRYINYINKTSGIILVTGPTGSGKTTTLYASVLAIDRKQKNILTIEDPVEYAIEGITQVQINPAVDLTFAKAIRSFLRQDPDVLLVGEIRDEETAKAAIQAALTGHLVLSTLHTNDSATAVARLIEMEIEPFLISSSLLLVISQRLVRKVCPYCSVDVVPSGDEVSRFLEEGIVIDRYKRGTGCEKCFHTGYRGRTPIFEFMEVTENIRKAINKKASANEIKEVATEAGFKPIIYHGAQLVISGITTPEEVIANIGMD